MTRTHEPLSLEVPSITKRYLRPHWLQLIVLIGLTLAAVLLQVAGPYVMRRFIDITQMHGLLATLRWMAFGYFLVVCTSQFVGVLDGYLSERLSYITTNALRVDLMRECLSRNMAFHNLHQPGEMIERIEGDVGSLSDVLSRSVVSIVSNILLLAALLVAIFVVDWQLGIGFTVFSAFGLTMMPRLAKMTTPRWIEMSKANAELLGYVQERLAAAEALRSNGAARYVMRGLYPLMRELFRTARKAGLTGGYIQTAIQAYTLLGFLGLGWIAASLYMRHAITIGQVFQLFSYLGLVLAPVQQLSGQIQGLQQAAGNLARLRQLVGSPQAPSIVEGSEIPSDASSVVVNQLTFGYDPTNPVLTDVSFTLPAGKTLGILGRTGSGKTTFIRLLFRFFEPDHGRIFIGGADITSVPVSSLRQHIGLVTQDVHLFHGSVRDNITLFNRSIADGAILSVLEDLEMGTWLRSLPQGLDTVLEAFASDLSSGQAQLLSLSRVFLTDPSIVVLDEPSSRLDPATDAIFQRAIAELLGGRTSIIIAHRITTLQSADFILVLDNGRVLEFGERRTLAGNPESSYSRLLESGKEIME